MRKLMIYSCSAQSRFKLKNTELRSYVIDVDQPGGQTLASRRHAEGVTFTEDEGTGRLRAPGGQCLHTGPGNRRLLVPCL